MARIKCCKGCGKDTINYDSLCDECVPEYLRQEYEATGRLERWARWYRRGFQVKSQAQILREGTI